METHSDKRSWYGYLRSFPATGKAGQVTDVILLSATVIAVVSVVLPLLVTLKL